jgi:hypothetical protein
VSVKVQGALNIFRHYEWARVVLYVNGDGDNKGIKQCCKLRAVSVANLEKNDVSTTTFGTKRINTQMLDKY